MSYISDYLCHFVGRSCANDDARFELLVKIINEKQLKSNLSNPDNSKMETTCAYSGNRLGEIFEHCDCVCLCDIPDEMLGIHTSKYSRFGMGFNKSFLSGLGARPVMYVPLGAKIKEPSETNTPKDTSTEYYLYLNKLSSYLSAMLMILNQKFPFHHQYSLHSSSDSNLTEILKTFDKSITQDFLQGKSHQLLFSEVVAWATQCAYIKVFDETMAEDDPDNYYMEREWRSLKSVDFTLSDIQKVYLPSQQYKDRFITEFPDYSGEFWLFDEQ